MKIYVVVDEHLAGQISVCWEGICSVEEWLNAQPHQSWRQIFEEQGVLVSFILLIYYEFTEFTKPLTASDSYFTVQTSAFYCNCCYFVV